MIAAFFYRETRFLMTLVALIVIAGLASLWTLGRQEDPTITNRHASIVTALPGAEPSVIETLVSTVLEAEIKTLQGIDTYTSSSVRGASVIGVTARDELSRAGIDQLWSDLRAAIDRARPGLPDVAQEPQLDTRGVTAYTTVIAVEMINPDLSPAVAARFATAVEARLRALPQTRIVTSFGKPEEEITVSLDPFQAAADGITIEGVADAIRRANAPALAGNVLAEGMTADLLLSRPLGQISDLRDVPVTSGASGAPARLADLAAIRRDMSGPPDTLARAGGQPAILIGAVIEEGAQVDRWMRFLHQDMEQLRADLPDGLRLEIVFDQSVYTMERLTDLGRNLALGIFIVFGVLVITLGLRAAAIVGVMLPLVSLATLASFRIIEMPLHQMSLIGLLVALGLVVDAAIVTTDNVRRRLLAGETRADAAKHSAQRLILPLAASTVTTILGSVMNSVYLCWPMWVSDTFTR